MSEELERLWRLRGIDERVSVLRARLLKVPERKQAFELRVSSVRDRLQAHQKALGDTQLARRTLEQEIEAVTAQQRQFESRQPSVKTNAEYQALSHEIGSCRARRSDVETQVLIKLEEEERLLAARVGIEHDLKAAEAERATQRAGIEREEAADQAHLAELEAARLEEMGGLAAGTRQRYERIHASREGKAIVPILKNACGGCFRQQAPQTLQEARRGERIIACDGCGRLVIWPPELASREP